MASLDYIQNLSSSGSTGEMKGDAKYEEMVCQIAGETVTSARALFVKLVDACKRDKNPSIASPNSRLYNAGKCQIMTYGDFMTTKTECHYLNSNEKTVTLFCYTAPTIEYPAKFTATIYMTVDDSMICSITAFGSVGDMTKLLN